MESRTTSATTAPRVDRLDAEGQHQSPAASRAFEAPDALAKFLDTGTDNGVRISLATVLEK